MDKLQEIKEKIKQESKLKIVESPGKSLNVYKSNKAAHTSEEVAWIRKENNKIVIIIPSDRQEFAKKLGFVNIHQSSLDHYAGYIFLENEIEKTENSNLMQTAQADVKE